MKLSSSVTRAAESEPHQQPNRRHAGGIKIPRYMIPTLRSDYAGEAGAVEIYKDILAVTRDDTIRAFARHHPMTETKHLELLEGILIPEHRNRLLPLCRWAGWITGALPALIGAPAVYRTINAVESFVDGHYFEQIVALDQDAVHHELRSLLQGCRSDEIAHRDDARFRAGYRGWIGTLWTFVVMQGSRLGVTLAERIQPQLPGCTPSTNRNYTPSSLPVSVVANLRGGANRRPSTSGYPRRRRDRQIRLVF